LAVTNSPAHAAGIQVEDEAVSCEQSAVGSKAGISDGSLKLLLFDIDGTLMLSGGAARRAMDRAFSEMYGIDDAFGDIVPDGKTDPLIFREIVSNHHLSIDDEPGAFAGLAELYARRLVEEMPTAHQATLMPGALPLLEHLALCPGVALGVLTGNFEATARIKLERFSLNRFFAFGAFASDHADRERLLPVAVARAEVFLGRSFDLNRHIVVIGDTPRDVECALIHNATAIGVAASRYSLSDLETAGAHAVLQSLEDVGGFMRAIGLRSPRE
jgi:phosphoglycolate phosphatase-like HAD superfamily hydrolase